MIFAYKSVSKRRRNANLKLAGAMLVISTSWAQAQTAEEMVMVNDADACAPTACRDDSELSWGDMNALQRHIAFFDLNQSGKINLRETTTSLGDLGLAPVLAYPAAMAIHAAMATPSSGHPSLTIDLSGIEAGIHGSDSGLYGNDGEFIPERFDAWFQKWDRDANGALDGAELANRLYQESDLLDVFGVFASGGEYAVLYLVAAESGKISKERMLALYDGSLFYRLAIARGRLGTRLLPPVFEP